MLLKSSIPRRSHYAPKHFNDFLIILIITNLFTPVNEAKQRFDHIIQYLIH